MAERDFVRSAEAPKATAFIPGTGVEIIRPGAPKRRPEHALFDFDGTLSLIREGWMDIMVPMLVEALLPYARTGETEGDIRTLVLEFVTRLTGKQTVYQMMALADEIKARGGAPEEPLAYKERYHDLLLAKIEGRRAGLSDGSQSPTEHLVPGSLRLLRALNERGVAIYIASGTDEAYVIEEAALLGLDEYAAGGIYGAQKDHAAFSKEMVIRRILSEHRVSGERLLAFGDGYVEISDCKAAGGFAVGVASDEAGRSGKPDAWKRDRLIGAGADLIAPDYADAEALVEYLWSGERP